MKTGTILAKQKADKSADLKLINTYTRRAFTEEEVYTFSVVLCDNDIDRDFERFDTEALHKLAELFLGKTGVFDHNPKAENQAARIFHCAVEQVAGQKTKNGADYYRLVARAYLPKTDKNKDFILDIDSGIHKEVSVGCAVADVVCSECGENRRTGTCSHISGKVYDGQICHNVLKQPTDAYEWSFVAVPAQPKAGVIKSFGMQGKEENMEELLKKIKHAGEITLSKQQGHQLAHYMETLKAQANDGVLYRNTLTKEVNRLSHLVQPEIAGKVIEKLTPQMSLEQLQDMQKYYQAKAENYLPIKPQLVAEPTNVKDSTVANHAEYSI